MPIKILKIHGLRDKLGGVSSALVYKLVAHGQLPKPFKLGAINVWQEHEVDAALEVLSVDPLANMSLLGDE